MKNQSYLNEVMVKQCVSFRVLVATDWHNIRFANRFFFDDLVESNCSSFRSSAAVTRL